VVSEHVRGQLCAGLSAGAVQSSGLVSAQSGAGPVRAAAADSGVRPRAAAAVADCSDNLVALLSTLGGVSARRLDFRSRPFLRTRKSSL
jgi:hypothetical protein